jgi:hypothetical protein
MFGGIRPGLRATRSPSSGKEEEGRTMEYHPIAVGEERTLCFIPCDPGFGTLGFISLVGGSTIIPLL